MSGGFARFLRGFGDGRPGSGLVPRRKKRCCFAGVLFPPPNPLSLALSLSVLSPSVCLPAALLCPVSRPTVRSVCASPRLPPHTPTTPLPECPGDVVPLALQWRSEPALADSGLGSPLRLLQHAHPRHRHQKCVRASLCGCVRVCVCVFACAKECASG